MDGSPSNFLAGRAGVSARLCVRFHSRSKLEQASKVLTRVAHNVCAQRKRVAGNKVHFVIITGVPRPFALCVFICLHGDWPSLVLRRPWYHSDLVKTQHYCHHEKVDSVDASKGNFTTKHMDHHNANAGLRAKIDLSDTLDPASSTSTVVFNDHGRGND